MIPYLYGLLWTPGVLFEHGADVRGRLWTSVIEPWVRIPPPPPIPSIGSKPCFEGSPLMSLTVHMTAERGKCCVSCLCWLLESSVKKMEILISSMTSYLDASPVNRAQSEEGFTLRSVKHTYHEGHVPLIVSLSCANWQKDTFC